MIGHVRHAVRVVRSLLRERKKAKERSPHWPEVERAYHKSHPTCAACGTATRIQIHHKKPFHLDPALELEPSNLIALCMAEHECHLRIGHGDDFKAYNPNVEADAASCLRASDMRLLIEARAKQNRRYALGGA